MRGGVGGDCWAYWVIMSSHWNFIQELREGLGKPGRMVRATRPWVGLRAKARPRARPPGCSGRGVLAPRLLIRHPALHPWGCALLRVMHAFAPSFPLGAPVWGPETSFGGGGGGQSSILAEPGAQPGSGAPLGLPQAPRPAAGGARSADQPPRRPWCVLRGAGLGRVAGPQCGGLTSLHCRGPQVAGQAPGVELSPEARTLGHLGTWRRRREAGGP